MQQPRARYVNSLAQVHLRNSLYQSATNAYPESTLDLSEEKTNTNYMA